MNNKNNSTPFKKLLDFHEQTIGKSDNEKLIIAQSQAIDFDEYQRRIRQWLLLAILKLSMKNYRKYQEKRRQTMRSSLLMATK